MTAVHTGQALRYAAAAKTEANLGIKDRRTLKLKESAITTWRAILKIIQQRGRAGLVPHDDGLYHFKFTNADIAAKAGCSTRTVMRHRAALAQAGIIQLQLWHGSQHPFEIAIQGRYLGLVEPLQADAASDRLAEILDRALASEDKMSALPEIPEEIKQNARVDNCGSCERPDSAAAGECDPTAEGVGAAAEGWKHGKQGGNGGAGHPGAPERTGAGAAPPTLPPIAQANAALLWAFARRALWHGAPITQRQEALARRYIVEMYAQVNPAEMDTWHGRFCGMVSTAADYIARKPDRYITSPDHWFKPGNHKGFRGTWAWYLKRELASKRATADSELNRCWQLWQRNERAYPSRRRDRLELWRALTDRVAGLGDQGLLDLWMAKFAEVRNG